LVASDDLVGGYRVPTVLDSALNTINVDLKIICAPPHSLGNDISTDWNTVDPTPYTKD